MTTDTPFIPVEILHEIAQHSERAYRALLALPHFARSFRTRTRAEYQERFGYTVEIGEYYTVWRRRGVVHRSDGPAVEFIPGMPMNSIYRWIETGETHFTRAAPDAPTPRRRAEHKPYGAVVTDVPSRDSTLREWMLHTEGNVLRFVRLAQPIREWRRRGELHRTDGPAVESPDAHYWYQRGLLHREDGPAIEYTYGDPDIGKRLWFKHGTQRFMSNLVEQLECELVADYTSDDFGEYSYGDPCDRELLAHYIVDTGVERHAPTRDNTLDGSAITFLVGTWTRADAY